jgi:hypothetical protein
MSRRCISAITHGITQLVIDKQAACLSDLIAIVLLARHPPAATTRKSLCTIQALHQQLDNTRCTRSRGQLHAGTTPAHRT